jgi:hypothetical protein
MCVKLMALLKKLLSQFNIVKDLTIKNEPDGFIFIVDGLLTTSDIDNAKARMGKTYLLVNIVTGTIRTAMMQLMHHALQSIAFNNCARVGEIENTGYATHIADLIEICFSN